MDSVTHLGIPTKNFYKMNLNVLKQIINTAAFGSIELLYFLNTANL